MTFLEYLWSLCPRPLKRLKTLTESDGYKLMTVLANAFEKVRVDVYFVRKQFLIKTCDETTLMSYGQALNIPKFDSETVEQYRDRLLGAWDYFRLGGTIPGMLAALEAMGYQQVTILEHYTIATPETLSTEWATFSVLIDLAELEAGTYTRDEVQSLIRRIKPAHTLGASRLTCLITDSADGLTDTDLLCQ